MKRFTLHIIGATIMYSYYPKHRSYYRDYYSNCYCYCDRERYRYNYYDYYYRPRFYDDYRFDPYYFDYYGYRR